MNKGKEAITLVALLAAVAVLFRRTIMVIAFRPDNTEKAFAILVWCLGIFAVLFAILSIATLVLAWRKRNAPTEKPRTSLHERMQKTSWMRLIPFLLALVCFFYLQEYIFLWLN